jgi:predicted dehydrogenase
MDRSPLNDVQLSRHSLFAAGLASVASRADSSRTVRPSFSYAETSRLQVVGDQGRVVLDPATNYRGIQLMNHKEHGEEQPQIEAIDQFAREMDHVADAVMTGSSSSRPAGKGCRMCA